MGNLGAAAGASFVHSRVLRRVSDVEQPLRPDHLANDPCRDRDRYQLARLGFEQAREPVSEPAREPGYKRRGRKAGSCGADSTKQRTPNESASRSTS